MEMGLRKIEIEGETLREWTYREFMGRRRRRRREVDVEGHGASQGGAKMLVPLVVPSKHL